MIRTYKFAELFSEEARRAACEKAYEPIGHMFVDSKGPDPRFTAEDGTCYCPIGFMLAFDGYIWHYELRTHASPYVDVALSCLKRKTKPPAGTNLSMLAFMRQWDAAKITDLAAALGVDATAR